MESSASGELVGRAMAGDRFALDELWRGHRRFVAAVLLAYIPRSLPGPVDLEDLLQDVAMKLVAQIHRLHAPETFRPWLRTVARNVALSHGRRLQVRGPLPAPLEVEPVDPAHAAALQDGPIHDQLEDTLRLVHGLHADYREPLLMRTVEGMSQRAIAAALDLPVTTVESRLARARRLLRAAAGRSLDSAAAGSKPGGRT
jgi:RNA polymerase sigma-70 factor (ECF subfamily)